MYLSAPILSENVAINSDSEQGNDACDNDVRCSTFNDVNQSGSSVTLRNQKKDTSSSLHSSRPRIEIHDDECVELTLLMQPFNEINNDKVFPRHHNFLTQSFGPKKMKKEIYLKKYSLKVYLFMQLMKLTNISSYLTNSNITFVHNF